MRTATRASHKEIADNSGVSPGYLYDLENGLSDVGITSFDRVCRSLGLTADELIYLAFPPKHRWALFLLAGNYSNQQMVDRILNANLAFEHFRVEERAQVLLGFKAWLSEEYAKKPGTIVATPNIFEILELIITARGNTIGGASEQGNPQNSEQA